MNGRIEVISGTLGGGKSTCAVERTYYHLLRGGYAFTNIEMHRDAIAERMKHDLRVFDPSRLRTLSQRSLKGFQNQIARGTADSQVMVVLDEAALEWHARDYRKTQQDNDNKVMLDFITLCRKLDIILLFISQSPTGIDKNIRERASTLTMCRNLRQTRIFGIFPLPIPMFTRVEYDISIGNAKPVKNSFDIHKAKTWVFKLFDSDALLGSKADAFAEMETLKGSKLDRLPIPESVKSGFFEVLAAFLSCIFFFA